MSRANVELARRGYEAVVRGDLEAIRDLLAPDVRWHGGDPDDPYACHNREEVLSFMRQARRRAMGTPVEFIDAGDKVIVIMSRVAEDGESTEFVANLTTFRDGKVSEMVHYANPEDARAAAGVSPTP